MTAGKIHSGHAKSSRSTPTSRVPRWPPQLALGQARHERGLARASSDGVHPDPCRRGRYRLGTRQGRHRDHPPQADRRTRPSGVLSTKSDSASPRRSISCLGRGTGSFALETWDIEPGSLLGRTVDQCGMEIAPALTRRRRLRLCPRPVSASVIGGIGDRLWQHLAKCLGEPMSKHGTMATDRPER